MALVSNLTVTRGVRQNFQFMTSDETGEAFFVGDLRAGSVHVASSAGEVSAVSVAVEVTNYASNSPSGLWVSTPKPINLGNGAASTVIPDNIGFMWMRFRSNTASADTRVSVAFTGQLNDR